MIKQLFVTVFFLPLCLLLWGTITLIIHQGNIIEWERRVRLP